VHPGIKYNKRKRIVLVPLQATSDRPKITLEILMPDDPDDRIMCRVSGKGEDSLKIDVCIFRILKFRSARSVIAIMICF
jgi:hypothetical protein